MHDLLSSTCDKNSTKDQEGLEWEHPIINFGKKKQRQKWKSWLVKRNFICNLNHSHIIKSRKDKLNNHYYV